MISVVDENGNICPNVVIEWKDTIEASEKHQAPQDDDVLTCRCFINIEESASMYFIWRTYTGNNSWDTSVPADGIPIELYHKDRDSFGHIQLRPSHKHDSFSDTGDIVIFLMFYETLTMGCHAMFDTPCFSLDTRRNTLISFTYEGIIHHTLPANSSLDIGGGKSIHVKLVKREIQPGTPHIADVFISLSDNSMRWIEYDEPIIDLSSESDKVGGLDEDLTIVTSELSLSQRPYSSTLEIRTKRSRESPTSSSNNHNQNESESEGGSEGKSRVYKKTKTQHHRKP